MFTLDTTVRLHDTDAAGLLFFGHQFKMAHDAYESFMDQAGFALGKIITEMDFLVAIVHAEADFTAQLQVGDRITIELIVSKIGETSYTLAYNLVDGAGKSVGTVQTVHVVIDKKTRGKRGLPGRLRQALQENTN